MTVLVALHNVSKVYRPPTAQQSLVKLIVARAPLHPDVQVLKSISLSIRGGEAVGIIGRNGSGKSTLLKLIAGILSPSSGSIEVRGDVLPLFSWETCFIDDLEVFDNLHLFGALIGLSSAEVRSCLERVAALAGVSGRLNDQMRTFSPGMKARLALSLANESKAEVVLLDEALSAGDSEFRNFSAQLLREWKGRGRAIIHVSHDLVMLRALSDRCLLLEDGLLRETQSVELNGSSSGLSCALAKEA